MLTLKAFAVTLANSLISRGIDKETSVSTVLRITRSLTEEDKAEIAAYEGADDFAQLSDALVRLIEDEKRAAIIENATAETVGTSDANTSTKHIPAVHISTAEHPVIGDTRKIDVIKSNTSEMTAMGDTKKIDAIQSEAVSEAPMGETKQMDAVKRGNAGRSTAMDETRQADAVRQTYEEIVFQQTRKNDVVKKPVRKPVSEPREEKAETYGKEKNSSHYTEYQSTSLTARGAKFFWTFFVLTLPLLALAAIVYFGIFALCVLSVCALIVALFIILSAIVIIASLVAIVSLIYGAVMMISSQIGIGIYEIGVGVVTSGLAILLSVAVYLAATRAMPYLLRQLVAFTGHTLSQIPTLWDRAREECNKL